ncbi:MAG: MarR family transcriptional regulator [Deltaproteobacteria bacterium]|jgi:hypothetical protein|nr:MarR family transcriptional regulator [Deltaproteobacteria bacterium]
MPGRRSRPYNVEDVEFVFENYANMTASEIAETRGISKFQVSKIVTDLRKHTDLPKKSFKRPNPIFQFLEKKGISPKAEGKPAKAGKKK